MPRLVKDVASDPVLSRWLNNRSPTLLTSKLCVQSSAYSCKVSTIVTPKPVVLLERHAPEYIQTPPSFHASEPVFSTAVPSATLRNLTTVTPHKPTTRPAIATGPVGHLSSGSVTPCSPVVQHGTPVAAGSVASNSAPHHVVSLSHTLPGQAAAALSTLTMHLETPSHNGSPTMPTTTTSHVAASAIVHAESVNRHPLSSLRLSSQHTPAQASSSDPLPQSSSSSLSEVSNYDVSEKSIALGGEQTISREKSVRVDYTSPMETLFVPVFRRGRFVLGEMLGIGSANLNTVKLFYPKSVDPISTSRRFIVDLATQDCLKSIEYEWFDHSTLVVVRHYLFLDGRYTAHYTLFIPDDENHPNRPTKALARMTVRETPDCLSCVERSLLCECPNVERSQLIPLLKNGVWTWTQWITAFQRLMSCNTTCRIVAIVKGSAGSFEKNFTIRHIRNAAMGDARNARAHVLCRQYVCLTLVKSMQPGSDSRLIEQSKPTYEDCGMHSETAVMFYSDGDVCSRDISRAAASRGTSTSIAHGHVSKRFSCSCGLVFTHVGHFNAHKRAVHMKLKPHVCAECNSAFAKGSDLQRHAISVHRALPGKKHFSCEQCRSEFRLGSQLALHVRFVHDLNKSLYECSSSGCDGIFATRQGLRKHRLTKHQ